MCAQSCLTLCNPRILCPCIIMQDYWGGLPFPLPGYLPDPGIKPVSPVAVALTCRFFTSEPPGKPSSIKYPKITSHF